MASPVSAPNPWRSPWRTIEAVHLAAFSFGLVAVSTALGALVLPLKVLQVAPESAKNTYLAVLATSGLLVALSVQPIAGHLIDRATRNGVHRRPFIVIGTALSAVALAGLGVASSYPALVVAAIALQLFANIAIASY